MEFFFSFVFSRFVWSVVAIKRFSFWTGIRSLSFEKTTLENKIIHYNKLEKVYQLLNQITDKFSKSKKKALIRMMIINANY